MCVRVSIANLKKTKGKPVVLLRKVKAQQPFEKMSIDLIGPFPISRPNNKHLIVAVDY